MSHSFVPASIYGLKVYETANRLGLIFINLEYTTQVLTYVSYNPLIIKRLGFSKHPSVSFNTQSFIKIRGTSKYFRSRNFREFREFCPNSQKFKDAKNSILTDSRKFMHAKFFNFFFFSPNLLAALDNALILVSWCKKSRRQCNTKTRSASIAMWVLEKCLVHENEA